MRNIKETCDFCEVNIYIEVPSCGEIPSQLIKVRGYEFCYNCFDKMVQLLRDYDGE